MQPLLQLKVRYLTIQTRFSSFSLRLELQCFACSQPRGTVHTDEAHESELTAARVAGRQPEANLVHVHPSKAEDITMDEHGLGRPQR